MLAIALLVKDFGKFALPERRVVIQRRGEENDRRPGKDIAVGLERHHQEPEERKQDDQHQGEHQDVQPEVGALDRGLTRHSAPIPPCE